MNSQVMRKSSYRAIALSLGTLFIGSLTLLDAREDDEDNDGLTFEEELVLGTDPNKRDTDGDQFPDGFEYRKGSLPLNADSVPTVLTIQHSAATATNPSGVVISVATFTGKNFQIEHCPLSQNWRKFGPTVPGDGGVWQVHIPSVEMGDCGFFRVRFSDSAMPIVQGTNNGSVMAKNGAEANTPTLPGQINDKEKEDDCHALTSLDDVSIELNEHGKKRFFHFDEDGSGHMMKERGSSFEFTPFTFTARRTADCHTEITITYPTDKGETEVEVINLRFNDADSGTFTDHFFENGDLEDTDEGDFTIVPPGDLPAPPADWNAPEEG